MTKSRAYELSQEHAKEVARKLWLDKEITTNAVSFLAGMKAMYLEAEKMAYLVNGIGRIVELSDLQKLLGEQDG